MCRQPFSIRNPKAGILGQREMLTLPCGKCPKCANARVRAWIFRLEQELLVSSQAFFVTYTYRNAALPTNDAGQGVLFPRHLTLYWKLLRKYSGDPIRYFAVGEYGRLRNRPHYHAILLNCHDLAAIQDAWPHGHVDIQPLKSIRSVAYCLKYLFKSKENYPQGIPPFARMSKGLGSNYLKNNEVVQFHKSAHENSFVTIEDGSKLPLPKYFKDKMYDSYERYRLSNYLQKRADEREAERLQKILEFSCMTEEEALHSLYVEPYIDTVTPRLFRPDVQ